MAMGITVEGRSWGLLAVINLYQCDPGLIRDPGAINEFVVKLCDVIEMKRFGEAVIKCFGRGALKGYSMMQLIETSSITAHFDEIQNRAFIDIFSCKSFDPQKALQFCADFFKASDMAMRVIERD